MIGKMVVLYDFSRRREGERGRETQKPYLGLSPCPGLAIFILIRL